MSFNNYVNFDVGVVYRYIMTHINTHTCIYKVFNDLVKRLSKKGKIIIGIYIYIFTLG